VLAAAILFAASGLAVPALGQIPKPTMESEIKSAGARRIAGAELRRMLVGNTGYHLVLRNESTTKTGDVVVGWFRDERTRIVRRANGAKMELVWWIEADNMCLEQRFLNAGHQCYALWEGGGVIYQCHQPAGDCFVALRVAPGNPDGL
jgi:hypothetical protein